jgi:hypothetical protein
MAKRLLVIAKIFAKIVRGKITRTKKQDPKEGYVRQFLRRQKRFFINQQHEFMQYRLVIFILSIGLFSIGCKKTEATFDPPTEAKLIFKFKFDSTQVRLTNIGEPSDVAPGNAAQHPEMTAMSAHYIELAQNATTALGAGDIMYRAEETTAGGSTAINWEKAKLAAHDSIFLEVPVKAIKPGDYEYLRISLAYQNAKIKWLIDTVVMAVPVRDTLDGTLAGFIGFNTYIKNFKVGDSTFTINANKKQGFWGFFTKLQYGPFSFPYGTTGQAPEGATTVVNPLFATSPIPAGSCVVTAAFTPGKLTITGKETSDIIIEISFSINKSFEWTEVVADGLWEPAKGEQVTDMGIRGMIPVIK